MSPISRRQLSRRANVVAHQLLHRAGRRRICTGLSSGRSPMRAAGAAAMGVFVLSSTQRRLPRFRRSGGFPSAPDCGARGGVELHVMVVTQRSSRRMWRVTFASLVQVDQQRARRAHGRRRLAEPARPCSAHLNCSHTRGRRRNVQTGRRPPRPDCRDAVRKVRMSSFSAAASAHGLARRGEASRCGSRRRPGSSRRKFIPSREVAERRAAGLRVEVYRAEVVGCSPRAWTDRDRAGRDDADDIPVDQPLASAGSSSCSQMATTALGDQASRCTPRPSGAARRMGVRCRSPRHCGRAS